MNIWIKKYEDWSKQKLEYNFNDIFVLAFIIYFVSTMFDFCLTYITFRLDSDTFFMYEISFIIKGALGGNAFYCMLIVIVVMLPLIVVYSFNVYDLKRYGYPVNAIKICFYGVYSISLLHIIGGWTNFFHLINLRV